MLCLRSGVAMLVHNRGSATTGYQALHGLSPPLLGNGGSGARLPRHGSWASQLQERSTAAAAATPELMFPETTAGHIAEVHLASSQKPHSCTSCPAVCLRDARGVR